MREQNRSNAKKEHILNSPAALIQKHGRNAADNSEKTAHPLQNLLNMPTYLFSKVIALATFLVCFNTIETYYNMLSNIIHDTVSFA